MSDDPSPVVFREHNRRHLFQAHDDPRPTEPEIIEAMMSPDRTEAEDPDQPGTFDVVARLGSGRWVFVVWVPHPQGRLPIHARYANRYTRRRYEP